MRFLRLFTHLRRFLQLQVALIYVDLQRLRGLSFLRFSKLLQPQQGSLYTLLAANLWTLQLFELPSTLHMPVAVVLQHFFPVPRLRLSLAYALLARLQQPTFTSECFENKSLTPWAFCQRTPCGRLRLHSLQESLLKRETIVTHLTSSQISISTHEIIHTA